MSKQKVMMDFALALAKESKCEKRGVAAVITNTDMSQVMSIGVNGGPKGLANCLCVLEGKYGCIHAEVNALIKCNDDSPGKKMFTTLAPCGQCAASIINAPGRFSTVYYHESWREETGLKLLQQAGIQTIQI